VRELQQCIFILEDKKKTAREQIGGHYEKTLPETNSELTPQKR